MNPKQLVRLSNIIGIVSIVLLVYWVFTFIIIEVFGLKVFKENMTETFYLSVLGILALMVGALIMNIMFNLTRIAQKNNNDIPSSIKSNSFTWMFLALFPILLIILFGGDYLTSKKKGELLVKTAKFTIKTYPNRINHLINYKFEENWILDTEKVLDILSKTDESLYHLSILVKDSTERLYKLLSD